ELCKHHFIINQNKPLFHIFLKNQIAYLNIMPSQKKQSPQERLRTKEKFLKRTKNIYTSTTS
ncbi:MAG: hypothetical protein NTW67_05900, partial [Candidatus Woesearchaeota archaeon]|nr:hypothetical protein [Candidatus Woesearchaeota archaeon]